MTTIIFLIIIILLFIVLLVFPDRVSEPMQQNKRINHIKPILWSYWEIKNRDNIPSYINLCFETFFKHCSQTYEIIILNDKTVYDYLPDLRTDINQLNLAAKSDYIRIALLYKYGGLWLDADTIVMCDLQQIIDKLNENHDFIGFGCTGKKCLDSGYPYPSNGAMASQENGILVGKVLNELDRILDQYFKTEIYQDKKFGYFELGKNLIWKELDKLRQKNYDYYHFPASSDGSRDNRGEWIAPDLIFNRDIKLMDEKELLFVFLANSYYCGDDPKYNWFCEMSKDKILNDSLYISKLFNKSLNKNKNN